MPGGGPSWLRPLPPGPWGRVLWEWPLRGGSECPCVSVFCVCCPGFGLRAFSGVWIHVCRYGVCLFLRAYVEEDVGLSVRLCLCMSAVRISVYVI